MSRWTIDVSDDLDSRVRDLVAQHGSDDVASYVQKAVRRQLLRDTIHAIRQRNADEDTHVIEEEINQALDEARADRR